MASTPSLLESQVVNLPGAVVLKLRGEIRLDAREAEIQCNRLAAQREPLTILDLSGVSFMSSLGMGLLIALNRSTRMRGGALRLVGLQPPVWEAFVRMRLQDIFKNYETVEAAMAG